MSGRSARTNRDVAEVFYQLADLLEILGEEARRAQAYRRAAQSIERFTQPVAELAAEGRLQEIPGVGVAIAGKIQEILATGTCRLLEEARTRVPATVLALLRIPGVGPRTVHVLYQRLGITSVPELQEAALQGRLRDLPGFGVKKEQKILREIEAFLRRTERALYAEAYPLALTLVQRLADVDSTEMVAIAGSLRRGRETVKDIDLVAASPAPVQVIAAFCALPEVGEVLMRGETRASARLTTGIACDLRVVERPAWAGALQYFTGSQGHNVRLRGLARQRGYKLNEYGLFSEDPDGQGAPERIWAPDEHHLYERLGLPYIPPELREDAGEIEAALAGELPRLIKLRDIRGDLHVHTNWSDGRDSIEAMHARAAELGYEYLAVTDHSPSLVVAKGLDAERLRRQMETIVELRERLGPPYLLVGSEVDIRADGSLDFPDDLLAQLDIVIASVHSRFELDQEAMTQRIVQALEHPHVDVLAHPTGRILGRRDPYAVDVEAVLVAAARTGTVVEINASPERLDVPDRWARRAIELGVRLVINTDAHEVGAFDFMRYGVLVARRGWVEAHHVINTWPLEELRAFLQRPKAERAKVEVG